MTGRVTLTDTVWKNKAPIMVELRPANEEHRIGGGGGEVKADGSFIVENMSPGTYRFHLWLHSQNIYTKSVRFGNEEVLGKTLTIASEKKPGFLEVVLSGAVASVHGVVLDNDDKASSGATVVLVPEAKLREQSDLYKSATSDQYGRFSMDDVAPGRYTLFAWDAIEWEAYRDPEFMKKFEDDGVAIEVQERETKSVKLKLIPHGDIETTK